MIASKLKPDRISEGRTASKLKPDPDVEEGGSETGYEKHTTQEQNATVPNPSQTHKR